MHLQGSATVTLAELFRNGNHAVTLTRALVLPSGKKQGSITATFQLLGDVAASTGTSFAYSAPATRADLPAEVAVAADGGAACTCFRGLCVHA